MCTRPCIAQNSLSIRKSIHSRDSPVARLRCFSLSSTDLHVCWAESFLKASTNQVSAMFSIIASTIFIDIQQLASSASRSISPRHRHRCFAHCHPSLFSHHAENDAGSASFLVVASVPSRSHTSEAFPLYSLFRDPSLGVTSRSSCDLQTGVSVVFTERCLCEVPHRFGWLHVLLPPPAV